MMRELHKRESDTVTGGTPEIIWIDGKPVSVTPLATIPVNATITSQNSSYTEVSLDTGGMGIYCPAPSYGSGGGGTVRQENWNLVKAIGEEATSAALGENLLGEVLNAFDWAVVPAGLLEDTSMSGCNSYETWANADQTWSAAGYLSFIPWQNVNWGLFATPGQSWTQVLQEMDNYIAQGGDPFAKPSSGGSGGGNGGNGPGNKNYD